LDAQAIEDRISCGIVYRNPNILLRQGKTVTLVKQTIQGKKSIMLGIPCTSMFSDSEGMKDFSGAFYSFGSPGNLISPYFSSNSLTQ
jgi:hypothetical protein